MIAVEEVAALKEDFQLGVEYARPPVIRSRLQFAAEDFVIPEGKHRDTLWKPHTQPYAALLLREIDSGPWDTIAALGCVQSGKSLHAFVLAILYHLFECQETVVCGGPTMEVLKDKWENEIYPAILVSQWCNLLPMDGAGSRGGWAEEIEFGNGARLKFMSAYGGAEKRSSYTTRVVIMTEIDKMDEVGQASREGAPIDQMKARGLSYDAGEAIVYEECTASFETGRIWQDYTSGSQSRIACPCPHCGEHVTPEREHLRGWQDAENEYQAQKNAHFVCPACDHAIAKAERERMNLEAILLHRGQTVENGEIVGAMPETTMLGFRWSAFNNMFWSPGLIGKREWLAAHSEDEENNERVLLQFYWALPYQPPDLELTPLTEADINRRIGHYSRGLVPAGTKYITVGVDLGKYVGHYVVIAWLQNGGIHIPDYNILEIDSEKLGTTNATRTAMRELRDICMAGWTQEQAGKPVVPIQVWIDARWFGNKDAVYEFCRDEKDERFRPTMGYSARQQRDRVYKAPTRKTKDVRCIGDNYHLIYIPKSRLWRVDVNADHWKMKAQERWRITQAGTDGASLFHAPQHEHTKFRKHLTAEKPKVVWDPIRGEIIVFEGVHHRPNHYLDAVALGLVAGEFVESRITATQAQPARPRRKNTVTTPDGRAFLITERE